MKGGVYLIKNLANGKIYIGSATNVANRKSSHFCSLRKNTHHNTHLQSAWNKYGDQNFSFSVIQYCHQTELLKIEQDCILEYRSDDKKIGYNKRTYPDSNYGVKRPDVALRNKKRASLGLGSGKNHGMFGKKHSKEAREKISNRHKNTPHTQERKNRRKIFSKGEGNSFYGNTHTDESKIKMSMSKFMSRMKKKQTVSGKNDIYVHRLYKEWIKHGRIIIACNFDSTISYWETIDNHKDIKRAINTIKLACVMGAYVAINTASPTERHGYIIDYCESVGIIVISINKSPLNIKYSNNGKIYANIFLDDRSGLGEALDILEMAMYMVRGNQHSPSEIG